MESTILKPGEWEKHFLWKIGRKINRLSFVIQKGTKIKPEIDEKKVRELIEQLYGIRAIEVCELNSYDDRNFLITADKWSSIEVLFSFKIQSLWKTFRNYKNPNIKEFCQHGYVLKILNSFDSKKSAFVEGQTQLSLFLSECKHIFCA